MSIQVYDGSGYLQIPGTPGPQSFAHVGPEPPSNPEPGQMWVDDSKHLLEWDTEWQYPVLQNGWVAYGSYYGPARYRMLPNGIVMVEGLVKNGTLSLGTPIFTLPVGYRPAQRILHQMMAGGVMSRLDIYPSGVISGHGGGNAWVSLHFTFGVTT